MNPTETFGWYYVDVENRAPSWTGVREFYEFMCGLEDFPARNDRQGPYCEEITRERVEIGDVVQLSNMQGIFYHSLLVSGFENGDILVCAQSNDALDRPLSTYSFAKARFLHVLGVNVELIDIEQYFETLINGTSLLPINQIYLPVPRGENNV